MEILNKLVDHLVKVNYENVPKTVIETTRLQILDALAAIVAGTTVSVSGELEQLVRLTTSMGGSEESSMIGFGGKVPAPNAAFVNGMLCARRDYDDTQLFYGGGHTSRSIVPTALAVAEREGNVNGRSFLTAIALAHDLECRIAASGRGATSWYMVYNFIGAAAVAGKILGFDRKEMAACLTLAFHQICSAAIGGSADLGSLKGMGNGFACRAGVMSALLSKSGFETTWDFLDPARRGNFYDVFFHGVYAPPLITLDLGKTFMGSTTSPKEYPCCHGQHVAIRAVLNLLRKHNIKAEDVKAVKLGVNIADYETLGAPEEKKRNPSNVIETQFSFYWSIATAIVYGGVTIDNYTHKALSDSAIRPMISKIQCVPILEYSRDQMSSAAPRITPVKVEITTKDGRIYEMESGPDDIVGGSGNPVTFEFIARKFKSCCEYSVKPISEQNQEAVIDIIRNIENVDDVGQIGPLVSP
ncbi:MAG TPA: MmgE/PrpD family protein [Syntrophorhabdaceae bacterium]|nr:MmgE/PrpD family protein [Syntrophorhabdaceae bacterium]